MKVRPLSAMYTIELERLDVAIRMLWLLAHTGRWLWAEKLGINRDTLEKAYDFTPHKPYGDAEVFAFLDKSPSILPAALEAVRLYQEKFAGERKQFYDKLRDVLRAV